MKGASLWLCLLVILLLGVITLGKKPKHKKTHTARNIENSESKSSKLSEPLSRKEKGPTKSKLRHVAPRQQLVRRRKSNNKKTKKKTSKAKRLKTLADDPTLELTDGALRDDVSQVDDLGNIFPEWLPHLTKRKCGKCIWQECPAVNVMKRHCPSGLVRDQCNCCPQCANGVGMPCYISKAFSSVWLPPCGDDLECVPVYDGSERTPNSKGIWGNRELSEGICSCKDQAPVCGSNNVTYDNICEFREASARLAVHKNTNVTILRHGPCKTAPKIDSPPLNATVPIGNVVSFRCETSGFPLPRIRWFKRRELKKRITEEELPGYLSHAVTQVRGGPGKYQLTTWLTLDKVRSSDGGSYICRSSNDYGTVDKSARLTITES